MSIRCWWFGCEGHPDNSAPLEYLECMHCDQIVSYEDLVGFTRHERLKDWAMYWFWRKWVPGKCTACGKRYGHHDDCLPF